MDVFEVKECPFAYYRAWKEIFFLLFFNIGLLIGNVAFFTKYYLIIEVCVLGILLLKLFNKRSRKINKLVFNNERNVLIISYYQFIFLRFSITVPYNLLQFNYRHKTYVRGKAPKTLEIKNMKCFIAEIKQKYNIGWGNEVIDNIYNELKKAKQNEIGNSI